MKPITPSSVRPQKSAKRQISNITNPEMTSGPIDSPSAEDVALRAYYTYQNQGAVHGYDHDHWHAAEAALKTESGRTQE